MRARLGGQGVDVDPAELEHHRGEQPDLARAEDEGPPGVPDLEPLLRQERLLDRLGADAGRLGEDAEVLQVLRDLHDVLGVVDEGLGQVAVAEVDPPLVVDLLAGDVVPPDLVEDRAARPSDRAGDVVARLHLGHLVAHLEHLPEALVADDEVVAPGGGVAVEGLVDLAVGGVDPDLEHLHQDGAPFGDGADVRMRLVGQLRGRDVPQVDAVRLAGEDGDGFHRGVDSPKGAMKVRARARRPRDPGILIEDGPACHGPGRRGRRRVRAIGSAAHGGVGLCPRVGAGAGAAVRWCGAAVAGMGRREGRGPGPPLPSPMAPGVRRAAAGMARPWLDGDSPGQDYAAGSDPGRHEAAPQGFVASTCQGSVGMTVRHNPNRAR